jgi:glycosyltransferase involved in cell wall biosynthesis
MASSVIHRQARTVPAGRAPLRVAALMATTGISGPGRQLVALGRELVRRGVAFTVLLTARPGVESAFPAFVREQGLDCREMVDRGPWDPRLVEEVRAFIGEWRPDVVETHSYKPTSIMWLLKRRGVGCAWVAFHEGETDKGVRDWLYTRADFAMLRAADRVVVMSELQRAKFPARARNVRIVHNAVPELDRAVDENAVPHVLRRSRGAGPAPLVGAIGRLSREKGVDVFIDAVALLRDRGIAATGVIVGEGALEVELRAQVERLGLADRIVFTGNVGSMREVYEALDLMVIPSRSEGLPSVLLEALPTGLPVVSTRVGAMPEIAAREPEALSMVAPERADQLADAIAAELSSPASPAAAAARARVAATFSIERRAEHMLRIFDEARQVRGPA